MTILGMKSDSFILIWMIRLVVLPFISSIWWWYISLVFCWVLLLHLFLFPFWWFCCFSFSFWWCCLLWVGRRSPSLLLGGAAFLSSFWVEKRPKQLHQTGEGKTATPPKRKEQHHPTGERGDKHHFPQEEKEGSNTIQRRKRPSSTTQNERRQRKIQRKRRKEKEKKKRKRRKKNSKSSRICEVG